MCGGTAGDVAKSMKKQWSGEGGIYDKLQKNPLDPDAHFGLVKMMGGGNPLSAELGILKNADTEHKEQKMRDDAAADAVPADTSQVDSYAMSNTGLGVGEEKKRSRKHGMRQNILTSGQGLS